MIPDLAGHHVIRPKVEHFAKVVDRGRVIMDVLIVNQTQLKMSCGVSGVDFESFFETDHSLAEVFGKELFFSIQEIGLTLLIHAGSRHGLAADKKPDTK